MMSQTLLTKTEGSRFKHKKVEDLALLSKISSEHSHKLSTISFLLSASPTIITTVPPLRQQLVNITPRTWCSLGLYSRQDENYLHNDCSGHIGGSSKPIIKWLNVRDVEEDSLSKSSNLLQGCKALPYFRVEYDEEGWIRW